MDIRIQGQTWLDTWAILLEKLESHGESAIDVPQFVVDLALEAVDGDDDIDVADDEHDAVHDDDDDER